MEAKREALEPALNLAEFKHRVIQQFGPHLEHATPANVREFLDQMELARYTPPSDGRLVLDEPASSYEEIIRDFFARVLDAPTEEAVMLLWMIALDLSFSAIEFQYSDAFSSLFGDAFE